jgi:hypothetical protein
MPIKKTLEECETLDDLYNNDYMGYMTYQRYSEKMPVFDGGIESMVGIKYNILYALSYKQMRDEVDEKRRLKKKETDRIYREKKAANI